METSRFVKFVEFVEFVRFVGSGVRRTRTLNRRTLRTLRTPRTLPLMRIGIDLGGTKIEGIALDGTESCVGASPRRGTTTRARSARSASSSPPSNPNGAQGHRRHRHPWRDLRTDRAGEERQFRVADRPSARSRSGAALGRPVRLSNDANCFALSEATDGAGQGARSSSA